MKIEIWSDIACPWCYIGKRRFESALAEFPYRDQVEIEWKSFQLDPSIPEHYDGSELDYLSKRKGMPAESVAQMFEHVKSQAAGEGLNYDFDTLTVANSHLGHELIHFAALSGKQDAAKERLLKLHFEEGGDIGKLETLIEVAAELELDVAAAREALTGREFEDAVDQDIAEAHTLGIQGVPFFVIDRKYGVSGAQSSAVFSQTLAEAWRAGQPLTMAGDSTAEACGPDGCAI
ncbi:DsbA family oxidoreductase [Psychromicrobium lacuslunae]|uniref:DSBA oxidoreductase n=1 Tax=Psychromicrobium lacuslunae TaxID=1618207 RepID=A0A0D4C2G1_9MICC|nr:DsbA family oxidoreductase [Psychromicrobium lacuslunae]AJT42570.1 DSBA oxidoreductase [Psychromicrobium lacuslunae]